MLASEIIDDAKQIVGMCSDEVVLGRLSDALTALANKTEIEGIIGYVDICATSDCKTVTLPRDIDTPLAVNVCGQPAFMRNKWYEFHLNGSGSGQQVSWAWDDFGDVPVFMDIILPAYLICVADLKTDRDAVVRVFGYDSHDQWIRTQEPDGTWRDGFVVPTNLISDFPSGIITYDDERYFRRIMEIIDATQWTGVAAHSFITGEEAALTLIAGALPTPFAAGNYYLRRIDANNVELYATREEALAGVNPVIIESDPTGCTIELEDQRDADAQTMFQAGANHNMDDGDVVTFTAGVFPTPVDAATDYYVKVESATEFRIFESAEEAESEINAVNCSTPGVAIIANNRKNAFPITTMSFGVNHNLTTGDQVQVQNSGGTLPFPLLPNTAYYVYVVDSLTITLHQTYADATTRANPVIVTDNGSGLNTVVKVLPAQAILGSVSNISSVNHGLSAGDFAQFTTNGIFPQPLTEGTVYTVQAPVSAGQFTLAETGYRAVTTTQRARAANVATIDTAVPHGLINGDVIDITGMGAAAYNAYQVTVAVTAPTIFTYANVGAPEAPIADLGGTVYFGRINITTAGSGNLSLVISRAFSVGFTSQINTDAAQMTTGDAFRFNSTGTMPVCNPVINNVTVYYLRQIDDATVEAFDTAAHAIDDLIRATTIRTRAAGIATITTAAAHGFINGDWVDVRSVGGAGYNAERVQITVTGGTTFEYANAGGNEGPTADVNGQIRRSNIKFLSLGSGTFSMTFTHNVTLVPFNSEMVLDDSSYILNNAVFQFTTTGTLPAPLALATDYMARIVDGKLLIYNMAGVQIVLTTIGTGDHTMNITQNFTATLPTSVSVVSNNYNNGDAVDLLTSGTAPLPLVAGTTYYLRRITDDTVEIYATEAQAKATGAVIGRIVPTTHGTGIHQFEQTLDNFLVKRVVRVEKTVTDGFVNLYAWDNGRSTALTRIGEYYSDETEPSYRRIKIGSCNAWIRVRYRKRVFRLRALTDYIPINNKLAILMMLKSIELFRTNFIEKAREFDKEALRFLLEEQLARSGPESYSIQFNDEIYQNPSSQYME